jgi:hypothetical protein
LGAFAILAGRQVHCKSNHAIKFITEFIEGRRTKNGKFGTP